MKKYKFPTLSKILKVKIGTKYIWEERVRYQTLLVHLLEDIYSIRLDFQAFSFYPNRLYFGMPLSHNQKYIAQNKPLWLKIEQIFEQNRWKTYSAFQHIDPEAQTPNKFSSFEDVGFGYTQLLLSELILMDFNLPSHGVGRQIELSLAQPLIGFAKNPISRMVTGRPGSLILKYDSETELLNKLKIIAKRKNFRQEPFYIKKCRHHPLKSVFKGKTCLNCLFK